MRVLIRGVKNAFRNSIRTVSVTLILALSIGLALIMLLSYQTVNSKIASVKANVGNNITINPAGAQGFQGGGEPLTEDQVNTIKGIAHVSSVSAILQDRLTPGTDNNLVSAIDAGTLGRRFNGGEGGTPDQGQPTRTFTLPIQVTGISNSNTLTSQSLKITAGKLFDVNSSDAVAVLGTTLAAKNNLTVGSTFTAYTKTITVGGIFDAGNQFSNSSLYMPIKTVQTLSSQVDQVSSVTATVDTLENVEGVVTQIKNKIGTDKVDVISNVDAANTAVAPLENVKSISLYSLIGSLVAGAVITLLIMMMIVRERRREIGVLKAIGSSNIGIVIQFVSESLVLTLMGSVLGALLGVVLSNPVLSVLINNSSSTVTAVGARGFRGAGGRFAQLGGQVGGSIRGTLTNLHTTVGVDIILYGFLAALAIAIIGSAIPAWLIAKVKPAEVMRAE